MEKNHMVYAVTGSGNGKQKAKSMLHPGWFRFFGYARGMGDGTISRLVIREKTPVFLECVFSDIDLTDKNSRPWEDKRSTLSTVDTDYSPEWTKLVRIAGELVHCEFLNLEIKQGVPVSIGELVNKEKLA